MLDQEASSLAPVVTHPSAQRSDQVSGIQRAALPACIRARIGFHPCHKSLARGTDSPRQDGSSCFRPSSKRPWQLAVLRVPMCLSSGLTGIPPPPLTRVNRTLRPSVVVNREQRLNGVQHRWTDFGAREFLGTAGRAVHQAGKQRLGEGLTTACESATVRLSTVIGVSFPPKPPQESRPSDPPNLPPPSTSHYITVRASWFENRVTRSSVFLFVHLSLF